MNVYKNSFRHDKLCLETSHEPDVLDDLDCLSSGNVYGFVLCCSRRKLLDYLASLHSAVRDVHQALQAWECLGGVVEARWGIAVQQQQVLVQQPRKCWFGR